MSLRLTFIKNSLNEVFQKNTICFSYKVFCSHVISVFGNPNDENLANVAIPMSS